MRIIQAFEAAGWSRRDFQPHGGHLFGLQVAAGQPIVDGATLPPAAPGIGFESRACLIDLLRSRLAP